MLEGALVVVVGGSSGMGLATARSAVAAGARVVLVGRDATKVKVAADELGAEAAHAVDISDEDAVAGIFAALDRVDHVVSFAGEQPVAPITETDYGLYRRAMDTRVWGAMALCKHAVGKMPETGSFTFTSGVSAHRPHADRSVGAVATAAVESFARAMAVELAPIRVNAICPGAVDTPVLARAFGERRDEVIAQFTAGLPAGRIAQPDEIADAVLFLMRNAYVTGITLRVDGGRLLI